MDGCIDVTANSRNWPADIVVSRLQHQRRELRGSTVLTLAFSKSLGPHLSPSSIPFNAHGLVVARELLPVEPQLKSEVGWCHDHADVERANVELGTLPEEGAFLSPEDELVLLDAVEVASHMAELRDTGYDDFIVS